MSNTQAVNSLFRLFATHPIKITKGGLCAGPILIGHRGASHQHPENTIPSFAGALELGAHIIELDVRLSKDNEVVVIHDPTVDRTTCAKGLVNSFTLAELKALPLKTPIAAARSAAGPAAGRAIAQTVRPAVAQTIEPAVAQTIEPAVAQTIEPAVAQTVRAAVSQTVGPAVSAVQIATLEEVFRAFPEAIITVEIKDAKWSLCLKVLKLIERYGRFERTTVELIAIKGKFARALRKLEPRLTTGHTSGEIIRFVGLSKLRAARFFKARGAIFEVPLKRGKVKIVTRSFVHAAHKKGIRVFVWTINDANTMAKLFKMGVDGIFTDDLKLAKTVAEHIQLLKK